MNLLFGVTVSCLMINAHSVITMNLACHNIILLIYFIHPKVPHRKTIPTENLIKVLSETELVYISVREMIVRWL